MWVLESRRWCQVLLVDSVGKYMTSILERLPYGTGNMYWVSTTIEIAGRAVNARIQGGVRDCFPRKHNEGEKRATRSSQPPEWKCLAKDEYFF
eukprot:1595376-Ditylum_brightwellii.AAC.1